MTRKRKDIVISEDNRDKGKHFVIVEMSAYQAELWAFRVFQALAKSGVDISYLDASTGMAGIAFLGIKALAGMNFSEAQFLMDEMFRCISIAPNANNREMTRDLVEEDIEEISTRIQLRKEVLELHTGFSFPGAK